MKGKSGTKHTERTKKILSEKKKHYLRQNPDKHVWKRKDKKRSAPCEKLKELLKSAGISFEEEITPLQDRYFSIDIAFPEYKIGIEVNGGQHYDKEGKLKTYYQERHDLIVAAGWSLLELHYAKCYHDDVLEHIKQFLRGCIGQDFYSCSP